MRRVWLVAVVSFLTACGKSEAKLNQWVIVDGRKPSVDEARTYGGSIFSLESVSRTGSANDPLTRAVFTYSCEGSENTFMISFPANYEPTTPVGVRVGKGAVDSGGDWHAAEPTPAFPGGFLFLQGVQFDATPLRKWAGDTVSFLVAPKGRETRAVRFDLTGFRAILDTAKVVCKG